MELSVALSHRIPCQILRPGYTSFYEECQMVDTPIVSRCLAPNEEDLIYVPKEPQSLFGHDIIIVSSCLALIHRRRRMT